MEKRHQELFPNDIIFEPDFDMPEDPDDTD